MAWSVNMKASFKGAAPPRVWVWPTPGEARCAVLSYLPAPIPRRVPRTLHSALWVLGQAGGGPRGEPCGRDRSTVLSSWSWGALHKAGEGAVCAAGQLCTVMPRRVHVCIVVRNLKPCSGLPPHRRSRQTDVC